MTTKRSLVIGLAGLLLAAAAIPSQSTATEVATAGEALDVTSYDITMNYQPDAGTLQGTTVISATAAEALDTVTLHLDGPKVGSVTVGSEAAKSFVQTGDQDLVVVPAKTIAQGAKFRVRVEYEGTPGAGWLPTESGGASTFLASSSAWFPVREAAYDKADFRLTATVPAGWTVVSIGREEPAPPGSAANTFRWTEPDVDPDVVAVSVDRFTVERSALADGTPVVNAYAPGLRQATKPLADRLPEILGFLSGAFGRYPFDAAGNVFVQVDDNGPGTSPQTRPVYLGAGSEQYTNIDLVVHEQAHQWYGVSTDARRPEDACLAECFAEYAPWMWHEVKDGADLDARYRDQVDAEKDNEDFWTELYRPGRAPGINMYDKGPLAVHALRRQVGEESFHRLLRQWPQRHRGDYVDWPQFEAFAERVTRQDLDGFFQAWFRSGTVPADEYLWPGGLKP